MTRIPYAASALLLLSAVLLSCGTESSDPTAATTPADHTETAIIEAETEYHADYLPDADYNGYEFRVIGYSDSYPVDFEKETGAIIDDAIYRRNRKVEEEYNIKIKATQYPFTNYTEVSSIFTKAGRAQSDDFDLAALIFSDAYDAVLEGLAPTASNLPIVDLTANRPWYQNSINESVTISGVGLLCYTAYDTYPGGGCLIFNKNLVAELDLDDPYTMVDNGTWTLDVMYKMGLEAISDLDGNSSFSTADRFAFIGEWDNMSALAYTGSGVKLVEIKEGIPTVSQDERLIEAFTTMQEYTKQKGYFLDTFKEFGTAESSRLQGYSLFKQGQSLFVVTMTSLLISLGDMEDDFGILPYPKWTAEQDRYYCYPISEEIAIPLSCSADLERVMVIKEALAIESLNEVYPMYYENALKNRYIRDNESLRMLELIVDSTLLDLGQNPFWDEIRSPWQKTLESGKPNFASAVDKNLKKSQKALDKLMEMINSIK